MSEEQATYGTLQPVNTEVEKIIQESHLPAEQGAQIKDSYKDFWNRIAEVQANSSKVNFDDPNSVDSKIAGDLRKQTVKIRTGALALKDERKKEYLLKGNVEQAMYNLIKSNCELMESNLEKVEKAIELKEKARIEELKRNRADAMRPYFDNYEHILMMHPNLGVLTDEQFDMLVAGYKATQEAKIQAGIKADQERLERAEKERVFQERRLAIAPLAQYNPEGVLLTFDMSEELFQSIIKNLRDEKERIDAANELSRKEAERLKQVLEQERIKNEAEAKRLKDIADAEKAEAARLKAIADAELKKLQEEKQAAEDALTLKRNQELKVKQQEEAAKKKAAKAPDKQKLLELAATLDLVSFPAVTSIEAQKILDDVEILIDKVVNHIKTKVEETL